MEKLNINVEFQVTEKALVYGLARFSLTFGAVFKPTKEECMQMVRNMFETYGVYWTEHVTTHQRYHLRQAFDLAKELFHIKAPSIDKLE